MAGAGTKSVIAALSANSIVTVAKFIGFAASGSGAMLSEAIHSAADTGNQLLLYLGIRRSAREADESHPYGYGRARFFWGLVSALGIFFLGAGVTLYHGVHSLLHPTPSSHGWVTWLILGISIVLEGAALAVATLAISKEAKAQGVPFKVYVKEGRDPTAIAVLMEDSAALLGLFLAIGGIAMEMLTGSPVWDAAATLSIGVLLALVAIFLVAANREFLLTRAVDSEAAAELREILSSDSSTAKIERMKAVVVALGVYRVAADVEFDGRYIADRVFESDDVPARVAATSDPDVCRQELREFAVQVVEQLAVEIDRLEARMMEAVPQATHVDIEVD